MAARQFYYAESTGESTTTSTTYQDKTTLTFTPDDNSDYLIIWSALIQTQSISANNGVKAKLDQGGTVLNEQPMQPNSVNDYVAVGGIKRVQFGASPGSQTFKIQYASVQTASHTVAIKEAKIIAIKLATADQYAESEADSSTNQTTFQDKTTLTFTPSTTGDYLIIASAEINTSVGGGDSNVRILDPDGTTGYNDFPIVDPNTAFGSEMPWFGMVKLNLSNISKTFKIQWNSNSAGVSHIIARARIVALRLDGFDNNYYQQSRARATTTSAAYQDKAILTDTPLALNHVIFAVSGNDDSSTAAQNFQQLIEGATVIAEDKFTNSTATTEIHPFFAMYSKLLANASTTWKTQYKSDGSATVGNQEAAIAVIQLDASPVVQNTRTLAALGVG